MTRIAERTGDPEAFARAALHRDATEALRGRLPSTATMLTLRTTAG